MVNRKTIALMCSLGVAAAAFCLMGAVTKADTEFVEVVETEEAEGIEETEMTEEIDVTEETYEVSETSATEESYVEEVIYETYESVLETQVEEIVEESLEYDDYGSWKITIYTGEGTAVYIADTPMARDAYISLAGDDYYEVSEPQNPLAYIDRMTPEEAGVFYRDFFEIRGISAEQILNCDEDVFNSVMAEWDYAGERAGMDANDLV